MSTSLIRNDFLRLNYGVSFQFNGLKPKHNSYFVEDGQETILKEFPTHLKKSKLRMDYLVLPVHLEIGPVDMDRQPYGWQIGMGAFAGTRIGTRQTLKYKKDGKKHKDKSARQMNTNDFIYGLSGYVGYGKTALYVKYDLNPIFQNNPSDEHNI